MKKWGVIITLSLAMFIIVIDITIMNVSITFDGSLILLAFVACIALILSLFLPAKKLT